MRQFIKEIRSQYWFKFISNRYVLSLIFFGLWMGFLDVNSWLIHRELNEEIQKLKNSIDYYQSEIASDELQLEQLNSGSDALEKFAREQYFLVAPKEEIYLIDFNEED